MPSKDTYYPDASTLQDIAPYLGSRSFDDAWQEFDEKGYCVFENVLSAETLDRARTALAPHFEKQVFGAQ